MRTVATGLRDELLAARSRGVDERATRASDASLDRAVELVEEIEARVEENRPLGQAPEQLAHLVTDSWDWHAELTVQTLWYAQRCAR